MTITIRDHITGESKKSWNQPGNLKACMAIARLYATNDTDLIYAQGNVIEVWTLFD